MRARASPVRSARAPRGAVALCAACSLGLAGGALGQGRAAPDDLDALTEPLLTRVEQETARSGSFAPALIEPLTALGLAYQEHGEHDLAVAALDRAYYLHRFNEGLHNLEQVPLLRRLIDSERALGRSGRVFELEQRLLELARRNRGDLRSVPIFREAAERQLELYERDLRGDLPLTIGIDGPGLPPAFGIWRARRLYEEAIATIIANRAYGHAELAELEDALTRTYYLEARGQRPASLDPYDRATVRRASLYGLGRSSYERRVAYTASSAASFYEAARALVALGDWAIVFSHNGAGLREYEKAHALLVENGAPRAAIEELFPTDVPVFLPTFAVSPLATLADGRATGYVDFEFEIGRYGQPRSTRIVATEGQYAAASARAVAAAIARSRFRPTPLAATGPATRYRLRYSLADGTLTPRD